ncbi:MAG: SH3 domain-containing protein [Treponema sp.]|nr:SH3 domain-containing protein [Treponema sp.]
MGYGEYLLCGCTTGAREVKSMKNKFSVGIILSVVFFLSTKLYAVDFKTKNESQLFTSYGTKRVYSNDIDEGEKLQVDSTTIYYRISNWDYAVKIVYKYAYYFTDLDNLVPYKESDLFANDILSSSKIKMNKRWISKTYFDLLIKNDRENIKNIQPSGYSNYQKTKSEYDEDYLIRISNVQTQDIFNILMNIRDLFNSCSLYLEKIEKSNDGYILSAIVDDWYMHDSKVSYSAGDSLVLNIKTDGDYLYISHEGGELLGTFVSANQDTINEIQSFLKTNLYDKTSITFPRHADGTCDYDGSSIVKQTSLPLTNVAPNKVMTVSENLKLRSAEATSSNVLTVMSARTKVKVLELGKAETIDGINSNWVKVEVISGKDRDGNKLKSGMAGWCYGGYLE